MRVTVVDRRGAGGWQFSLRTIDIMNTCPVCHGPRGEPTLRPFCEDGYHYSVDCWANPCGHVDSYNDVLAEAEEIAEIRAESAWAISEVKWSTPESDGQP